MRGLLAGGPVAVSRPHPRRSTRDSVTNHNESERTSEWRWGVGSVRPPAQSTHSSARQRAQSVPVWHSGTGFASLAAASGICGCPVVAVRRRAAGTMCASSWQLEVGPIVPFLACRKRRGTANGNAPSACRGPDIGHVATRIYFTYVYTVQLYQHSYSTRLSATLSTAVSRFLRPANGKDPRAPAAAPAPTANRRACRIPALRRKRTRRARATGHDPQAAYRRYVPKSRTGCGEPGMMLDGDVRCGIAIGTDCCERGRTHCPHSTETDGATRYARTLAGERGSGREACALRFSAANERGAVALTGATWSLDR